MKRSVLLVMLLLGCSGPTPTPDAAQPPVTTSDAAVRDAGTRDAGGGRDVPRFDSGPGCGDVTLTGECDGEVLVYCDDDEVIRVDCAARGRTCELQTELGGYWCVGGPGSDCEVIDTDVCEEGVPCLQKVCGGPQNDAGPLDAGTSDAGGLDATPRD